MVSGQAFFDQAKAYEGTPYVHQGRLPGIGMDCVGPLICAARALGIKPAAWDINGYGRVPDGVTLERLCDEHMQRLPGLSDAATGDAILCRGKNGPPTHLGVLGNTNPDYRLWVHAEGIRHKRVMLDRLVFGLGLEFVAAYRVPGVH